MKEVLLNCYAGFLWIVCFLIQIFVVHIIYRATIVYFYQKRVLRDKSFTVAERRERLSRLPSYDKMVWQLRKFSWDEYLEKK